MIDRTGFVFKVKGKGLIGEVAGLWKVKNTYTIYYFGDFADYEEGLIYTVFDCTPETLENNISNGNYIPITPLNYEPVENDPSDDWIGTLNDRIITA